MNNTLFQIEQNFRKLIIAECRFCGFDQYLAANPDFKFPQITADLYNSDSDTHITIPGLFGGFNYFLEKISEQATSEPILYVEQSSRMYRDSRDYSYFAVTAGGSRLLQGEERENIHQKFQQFAKRAHEKYMLEIKNRVA